MENYKQLIAKKISDNVPLAEADIVALITETADDTFGDYAFPCFRLAKEMRMSPAQIATKLASEITPDDVIVKVEAVNGYLNFFVDRAHFIWDVLTDVIKNGESTATTRLARVRRCVSITARSIFASPSTLDTFLPQPLVAACTSCTRRLATR